MSVSRPDAGQQHNHKSSSLLRKKRKRLDKAFHSRLNTTSTAIAEANAFLHRWLESPDFACHFLSCLPPLTTEDKEGDGLISMGVSHRSRLSRSPSHSLEDEGTPIQEAVKELFAECQDTWELLRTVVAVSGRLDSRRASHWDLPTAADGRESSRPKSKSATESRAKQSQDSLRMLMAVIREGEQASDYLRSKDDVYQEWIDTLSEASLYSSERCWRMLRHLVRAWHKQRYVCQEAIMAKEGIKRAKKGFAELHLAQVSVEGASATLPNEDVGRLLHIAISGFCQIDAWSVEPAAASRAAGLSRSSQAVHPHLLVQRAKTSAEFLRELLSLADMRIFNRAALINGLQRRLHFVTPTALRVMQETLPAPSGSKGGASDLQRVAQEHLVECSQYDNRLKVTQTDRAVVLTPAMFAAAGKELVWLFASQSSDERKEQVSSATVEQSKGLTLEDAVDSAQTSQTLLRKLGVLAYLPLTEMGQEGNDWCPSMANVREGFTQVCHDLTSAASGLPDRSRSASPVKRSAHIAAADVPRGPQRTSERTSKPPPRMGISRRSRVLTKGLVSKSNDRPSSATASEIHKGPSNQQNGKSEDGADGAESSKEEALLIGWLVAQTRRNIQSIEKRLDEIEDKDYTPGKRDSEL